VIKLRHAQPTVWEGLFAEEVAELWEPWMRVVDELLEDEELLDTVYDAQGQRHEQSRVRGRQQTPAEVALRMLILKHVRNWSYETLEREVRANVVYRSFCRIGMEKVPDAKTLVRLGQVIGATTITELHDRIVALAQERGVIQGRRMRVDTTVVETNIHYPTDSGLLNDGARVLTRTMKRIVGKTTGISGLRRSGEAGVLFSIESNSAAVVSPRKGSTPVAISYSTTPNEKRSVRPSSSLPSACSGDIYAMVPSALQDW
jgi:IS5 family transposase